MSAAVDRRLRDTFVELADTLVADYDVIEFLNSLTQRVVELLGVTASGVLLADHLGTLSVLAASTEQTRLLELFQLQNAQGPCLDAYLTGQSVTCVDLASADDRWPLFAPAARSAGFGAVYALPMRLREQVIIAEQNAETTAALCGFAGKLAGTVTLDAAGTKAPDGQALHYKWWVYEEAGLAGTHGADVAISGANTQQARITINSPCRAVWIPGLLPCRGEGVAHIILEVTDEGTPRLTSYRRVVLHVRPLPVSSATGK